MSKQNYKRNITSFIFFARINKLREEGFIEHLKWKWWEQNPKRVVS